MQFDLASYLLGLATLPGIALVGWLALRAVAAFTLRTIAPGGCLVCDHRGKWNVGDRINAAFYFDDWRHDLLWRRRRWHRRAWAAHRWNPAWQSGGEQHRVECNQPQCEFLGVAGPYSDLPLVVIVGQQHEKAVHGGALTTYIESTPAKV
ncbi:MAG: hypothetical protein J0J04_04970 [Microbacterium sp.]|uniref:hypothetical protein n=1 Tax=Microbacterium sp. TaxID=51671 RepID=UPI001AC0AC51|nr:hypothetical protein [Microbacterium sp.]MBN9214160.1 hypothetical protein [Microbacterium sp.]